MVKVISPPTVEPVTVNDFEIWMQGLPITPEQKPMVESLLKAGREEAESYQNRAYGEQTLQITSEKPGVIFLPRPPFRELISVTVGGVDVTTQCEVDESTLPATIKVTGKAEITYTAGNNAVPERVRQAILLYAAWAFRNREGTGGIPPAFYALLQKNRVIPV